MEKIVKEEKWDNVSDLINVSLKHFKDNYSKIIEEIKKLRLERIKKKEAYERASKKKEKKKEVSEEDVLEKVPVIERKKEDLEDIISALEDITGETYEISIDLDDEALDNQETSILEYTNEDIIEFEKDFPKKAIWRGKATIAFKEWLEKKYKN